MRSVGQCCRWCRLAGAFGSRTIAHRQAGRLKRRWSGFWGCRVGIKAVVGLRAARGCKASDDRNGAEKKCSIANRHLRPGREHGTISSSIAVWLSNTGDSGPLRRRLDPTYPSSTGRRRVHRHRIPRVARSSSRGRRGPRGVLDFDTDHAAARDRSASIPHTLRASPAWLRCSRACRRKRRPVGGRRRWRV